MCLDQFHITISLQESESENECTPNGTDEMNQVGQTSLSELSSGQASLTNSTPAAASNVSMIQISDEDVRSNSDGGQIDPGTDQIVDCQRTALANSSTFKVDDKLDI